MSSIKSRKARSRRGIRSVLMHKGERTSIDIIINPHYGIKVQEDANGTESKNVSPLPEKTTGEQTSEALCLLHPCSSCARIQLVSATHRLVKRGKLR